jgi:demethylmenaquinone methyltransferase/2-methoxy-6-polyprenyl-1,4-benzoquinol methylase
MTLWTNIRADIQTPDKKRDHNAGLFTRVAREYDGATRAMSLGRDQSWKRWLVEALPPLPSPRCVDLACGTGDVTAALARRYPRGEIIGLDLTPAMIEVASERCPQPNARFVVRDMCRTGIEDGWADVVTGSYALRNAPVLDDALDEIRRMLKPRGHAAFLDFAKPPARWRQSLQIPLLKFWGGFWGIVLHGVPEHAYIAESLRQFPDRIALRKRFARHGFQLKHSRDCFGGMLEILILVREQAGRAE